MKKNIVISLFLMLVSIAVFAQINIDAKAFLIEGENGQVLYEKNPDKRLPMASTTKIMTSLLALENADLKDEISVSKEALKTPYEHIRYKAGDKMKVKDALFALLLGSSNQTASVISENISFGKKKGTCIFIEKMNEKAKSLGLLNTSYKNPHGLDASDHFSSTRDLIYLGRYAMKNPSFKEICSQKTAVISIKSDKGAVRKEKLKSTFYDFLKMEGADGIKTGTTTGAKSCFVGTASQKNARLFICILGSPNIASKQAKTALEYCFENWNYSKIASKKDIFQSDKGLDFIKVSPERDINVFVPKKSKDFYKTKIHFASDFPIYKGEAAGYIIAVSKNKTILGSSKLVALETKLVPRYQVYLSVFILIIVIALLVFYAQKAGIINLSDLYGKSNKKSGI